MLHRRAFTGLIAGFGVAAATRALAQGKTVKVILKQGAKMVFAPETVNINVGDTVEWDSPGIITHNISFDPSTAQKPGDVVLPAGVAPFTSGNLDEDGTFSHTFTVKGTYKYVCTFHEMQGMTGTVIVS